MYRLVYEKRVYKDLDKISNSEVARILEVVNELSFNPFPSGTKKLTGKSGLYRVKQGNYRIVYTFDFREKEVRIILIRHRKEAYRGI